MTGKDKRPMIDEQLFLSAAKSTLDDSVDKLDVQVQARLAQIRRQALENVASRPSLAKKFSHWLLPATGLVTAAAALLLVVTLWTGQPLPESQQSAPMAVLEDINILTDSEEIEFYQNLEFYEWLAVNEQAVS